MNTRVHIHEATIEEATETGDTILQQVKCASELLSHSDSEVVDHILAHICWESSAVSEDIIRTITTESGLNVSHRRNLF